MRHRIGLLLLATGMLVLGACGAQGGEAETARQVQPDSNSGGDESLAGARGVFNDVVNDSVDATTGDNTDMKYIDIDGRGTMTIRVSLLQPQDLAGAITLMNEFGDVLSERSYAAGETDVRIENFSVLPGRYYVRVHASGGKTDYAIGRDFVRDPNYLSQEDIAWRDSQIAEARRLTGAGEYAGARDILLAVKSRFPENEEIDRLITGEQRYVDDEEASAIARAEEEERSRRSHRSSRRDRTTTTTPTPTETTQTTTPTEVTPPPTEEAPTVRATIISIRDRGAGNGTTLILTGCGSGSGLGEGDEGQVSGTSLSARIVRITGGNSCEAESSGSPGQIGSAGHVSF